MKDARILSEGNYLGLYERDGWEFADRPNATGVVGILPLTSNSEVILVEQFRRPVNARVIEIPAGGVRVPISSNGFEDGDQFFQMDGREVWNFAVKAFPQAVRGVLERTSKGLPDVDLIVPHQANLRIIEAGMKELAK